MSANISGFWHVFQRSEAQIEALREIARVWQQEGFWAFDNVLDALQRPGSLLIFAADFPEAQIWQAAALLDLGPFTADLLYIFVRQEARKGGLGRQLLNQVFIHLQETQHIEAIFLEVRQSNAPAQKLYEAANMERIGVRRSYYSNGEDAFVYRYEFKKSPT